MGAESLYTGYLVRKSRDKQRSGAPENSTVYIKKTGVNPVCGDRITWYIKQEKGIITDARYEVKGCLISTASASFLADLAMGKSKGEIEHFLYELTKVIETKAPEPDKQQLDNNNWLALAQIREYPTRKKCVLLAWETLLILLTNEQSQG